MPPGLGEQVGRVNTKRHHLALLTLHADLPAGQIDQHLADVQPKAGATGVQAAGAILFIEPLEHIGQRLRADALPGVPDGDLGFGAKLFLR